MATDIAKDLRNFIVDTFLFGQPLQSPDDASFLADGLIDSTGILELVSHIEEKYAIHVEDDELIPENLDSIANVVAYVQSKMRNQPQQSVTAATH